MVQTRKKQRASEREEFRPARASSYQGTRPRAHQISQLSAVEVAN
jgi:hypothetical protein